MAFVPDQFMDRLMGEASCHYAITPVPAIRKVTLKPAHRDQDCEICKGFGTVWCGRGLRWPASDKIKKHWALNSAVECHLHTVEVTGSNPVAPTISVLVFKVPER
jgi:hypothetical protein